MKGDVCSFPGEPGIPEENETESMSYSEEISESESINVSEEPSELLTSEPTNSENNEHDKKKKKKLSTGAIIGIVLGCLAFLALLILLIVCCCKKHKNNNIATKDARNESSIGLKKTPSKKGYESVDNINDNEPSKLMV